MLTKLEADFIAALKAFADNPGHETRNEVNRIYGRVFECRQEMQWPEMVAVALSLFENTTGTPIEAKRMALIANVALALEDALSSDPGAYAAHPPAPKHPPSPVRQYKDD